MSAVRVGLKREGELIDMLTQSGEYPMPYSTKNVVDIDLPLRCAKIEVKSITAKKGKKLSELTTKKLGGKDQAQRRWLLDNIAPYYDLWAATFFPYTGWRFYRAIDGRYKTVMHARDGLTYDEFLDLVRQNILQAFIPRGTNVKTSTT